MASTLLKLHSQSFKTLNPPSPSSPRETLISHLPFPRFFSSIPLNLPHKHTTRFLPLCSSVPSLSSPPTSKEEAILQAKNCLSSCLLKPINNPKLASAKLKKLKQPRFRVEIPLVDDDSPSSLAKLASSIFDDIPISRKGSKPKIVILWPDPSFAEAAAGEFRSDNIQNTDIYSVSDAGENRDRGGLNSADVAVFMAPEKSQIEAMETVTEALYPKPVVMLNPRWVFEEEKSYGDEFGGFVGSFDVVYAFTGLEVRGVLSKRKGVIFKCVRDGVLSGERWSVLVEEEDEAMKVVSSFKARPSMDEVETVLYNLMAMNSPITKSAKFLKDLVSNITGKK